MQEKIRAYLAAGAREVWIVGEDGSIGYYDRSGRLENSAFNVSITLPTLGK